MKSIDLSFQFEDAQYEMLEEEAKSLDMSMEELIANVFNVIMQEIQEDVESRNANEQTA
jgi:predicted DNA-binding ribbon-helix-helix protein